MKSFLKVDEIFGTEELFTETTAPKWLTSEDTIKGSTIDSRWFWEDCVLTLQVGESINTDYHKITRVA